VSATATQPPLDVGVLLVDDHLVMRNGLSALLEEENGVAVVGQASNGQEAIEQVEALMPDLVLMDFSMPVMDGVQARINHSDIQVFAKPRRQAPPAAASC